MGISGMGPSLGAEFIACTGGDMDAFGSTGRLAGVAGPAPVHGTQARISGIMRRPQTRSATMARQRANSLDDDVIVGPQSLGKADSKLWMDSDNGEIHCNGSRDNIDGIHRNSSGRWYMDDVSGGRRYFSYTSSSMCG